MIRQLELIAIEHTTPTDAGGQLVHLSITGPRTAVTDDTLNDLAIAIHGAMTGTLENRHLFAEHVCNVSERTIIDLGDSNFLRSTIPLVTVEFDIHLLEGRLIDFWLPYCLTDIQRQRAEDSAAWNRLVLDSVWVWLDAKLDKVDIATKALYVGDNILTSIRYQNA